MNGLFDQFLTATSGAEKKNGGTPEGARQGIQDMLNIAEKALPVQGITAGLHMESARKKLGIWLDNLVAKSQTKPTSQIVSLTPEMAEMLLDRNPANRKVSAALIETYAHEMSRGRWVFNGEPIIVADTGELNDGQHRCHAVIASGVAIQTVLIVGIRRETRTTLDQGKTRSAGDYLSMEGNVNTNVLAASANYFWQYRTHGWLPQSGGKKATKSEVLDVVNEHPGIVRSVAMVQVSAAAAVGGPSVLAFAHFAMRNTQHPEDADYFIHSLMSGAGLKAGSPILYARNRLVNERGRIRANEKAEIVFRGWNAWRRGESVSRMVINGGLLPILEA